MKEIVSKFFQCLIAILLLPIVLIALICLLLYVPIDYIKYKKSYYYKDFQLKYPFWIGFSPYYTLYNAIKSANLPIEYIPAMEKDSSTAFGYFLYDQTVILNDVGCLTYDEETDEWLEEIDDSWVSVEETMEETINNVQKIKGQDGCQKAVLLVEEQQIPEEVLCKAKQSDMFILYDDNIIDALKTYIHAAG